MAICFLNWGFEFKESDTAERERERVHSKVSNPDRSRIQDPHPCPFGVPCPWSLTSCRIYAFFYTAMTPRHTMPCISSLCSFPGVITVLLNVPVNHQLFQHPRQRSRVNLVKSFLLLGMEVFCVAEECVLGQCREKVFFSPVLISSIVAYLSLLMVSDL